MFLQRLRSLPARIRHCFSHNMSSPSAAAAAASVPYPIPRDPSRPLAPPLKKWDKWELDSSASHVHARVMMMIKLSNLDAAAEQALLIVSAARDHRSSLPSSTATCDAIIGALCRAGRYSDALEYFHYFFNESNMKPNVSCFNHIIGALCHQGRVDEALRFHRVCSSSSSSSKTPPNEETYSLLVKGLVDAGRIQEAEALIVSQSQLSGPVVFNHLIRGLLDQDKPETAMNVFRHLRERVVSSADDEISDLVHLIIDEDYNGIAMVTATFIEYWFKQGNDEEAMNWYTSLLRKRFVMNAVTGNNLLRILLNNDKKTEAWTLFDRMMMVDHQFNAETCNIMVNECFANSRFDEAVNIFQRVGTNISGSQLCYRNIISRFCEQGMLSEAGGFFEDMCSKQFIVPDIPTYRILLDAYANASRFDDAQRMANLAVYANLKCIAKFCPQD